MPAAKGTLFLIPTNLSEPIDPERILPAAHLAIVRRLDVFIAENAKSARAFLNAVDIGRPVSTVRITELTHRTRAQETGALLSPALQGQDVGLMSEAGAPGVADPGALLVDAAHREGIRVVPLVGPSSILLALMAAGLNGQNFAFHGYLPADGAGRVRAIADLERDSRKFRRTQLFIETPYRNQVLFEDLLKTLSASTVVCVAVDLTGSTEHILRATVGELRRTRPSLPKTPAMFLFQA
ncbi:MAG: SAM-dependent methyltransferase [Betaproteobacteria bacterium]|nr:SAM-dependent methyltransferase [Betaproteobacteria bacterium]